MKRTLILIGIALLIAPVVSLGQEASEKAAIKETILDYIEGWYAADAERMERALHPDLAKRAVLTNPNTKRSILNHATASMMVEYTRGGGGSKTPKEKLKNEIIILDMDKEMASVKTISPDFIDYVHLAKWNGQWKIVNVLWDFKEGMPER